MNKVFNKIEKTVTCWNWTGELRAGYGRYYLGNKRLSAHRYVYEMVNGKIPEGLQIDHLCHNKACVNPSHLEPVSASENIRRAHQYKAIVYPYCSKGHLYDEKNLYVYKNRQGVVIRNCRKCRVVSQIKYEKRKRLADKSKLFAY